MISTVAGVDTHVEPHRLVVARRSLVLGPLVVGTAEKVAEVEKGIKDGSLQVFDTSKFTVDGSQITTYTFNSSTMNSDYTAVLYPGKDYECIANGAFQESTFRSAPYFSLLIDGITQLS